MKTFIKTIAITGLSLMAACGPTLNISTDYDKSVNYSTIKTYKIDRSETAGQVNSIQLNRIEGLIRKEFDQRDLMEGTEKPDILVNVVAVLKTKNSISVDASNYRLGGIYRPYGYWSAPGHATIREQSYQEGSLLIDVIDAKTRKLLWTGTLMAEINGRPKNSGKGLEKAIAKLMQEFPVHPVNS